MELLAARLLGDDLFINADIVHTNSLYPIAAST